MTSRRRRPARTRTRTATAGIRGATRRAARAGSARSPRTSSAAASPGGRTQAGPRTSRSTAAPGQAVLQPTTTSPAVIAWTSPVVGHRQRGRLGDRRPARRPAAVPQRLVVDPQERPKHERRRDGEHESDSFSTQIAVRPGDRVTLQTSVLLNASCAQTSATLTITPDRLGSTPDAPDPGRTARRSPAASRPSPVPPRLASASRTRSRSTSTTPSAPRSRP